MIIYISKTNNRISQEDISDFVCVNPSYPSINFNRKVKVLMDSGAFQDTAKKDRITFQQALDRQLLLEHRIGFTVEKIVSYDLIGDMRETIKANEFLLNKNLGSRQPVVMVQGKDIKEYSTCLREVCLNWKEGSCLGFGGIAYAGANKILRGKLIQSLYDNIGLMKNVGVKDIHFFGLASLRMLQDITFNLKKIEYSVGKLNFNTSCDSSIFEVKNHFGKTLSKKGKWVEINDDLDKINRIRRNIIRGIDIISNI